MHVASHLTLQSHGGRLTVAGRTQMYDDNEEGSDRGDRMSVFSIADCGGPISNHSGMTHLPDMIAHLDINLPSRQDNIFRGLTKVKRLAWMVLFSNSTASFTVGLTISGAVHFALAEGIAITIAFLFQEIIHRIGDYTLLMKNRMNPSQALLGSLLSSSMCFLGSISGLLIVNKVEANVEWIFVVGSGYFMYNSFGILLHELDQAEAMSIFRDEKAFKPFILQNLGMMLGFAIISILTYAEFNANLPW